MMGAVWDMGKTPRKITRRMDAGGILGDATPRVETLMGGFSLSDVVFWKSESCIMGIYDELHRGVFGRASGLGEVLSNRRDGLGILSLSRPRKEAERVAPS